MVILRLDRSLDLPRSSADVFQYLRDFSTIEQWDPSVRAARKCNAGPVVEGVDFDLLLSTFGRQLPMRYTVTAIKPDQYLELEGRGEGVVAVDRLSFTDLGAQRCRLRYQAEIRLESVSALATPVLRRWGERLADSTVRGLRQALVEDGIESSGLLRAIGQRLLIPEALRFTQGGYRLQHSRGLSRRLDGQVVGITGFTSGLGLAAARQLARLGAELILVGRDPARMARARDEIEGVTGETKTHIYEIDLGLVRETTALAKRLLAKHRRIDVWINNAGALFAEREETPEGLERAMAVNLVCPAVLAHRLAPRLAAHHGRIINVVSGGLYLQGLPLDDLSYTQGPYDGATAYARAKRGLLALTQHWADEWRDRGLVWHAVHPGWAATPGVKRSLPGFERVMRPWLRDPRMGADSVVWLASHPGLSAAEHSGGFWFDRAKQPAAVLPGTSVSSDQARQLERWVLSHTKHS